MSLLPLALLTPLLFRVAYLDLAILKIPNWIVLLALTLAVISVPAVAPEELTWRIAAALVVFTFLAAFFALGVMGGGDVKLLPVIVLFVPPDHWTSFSMMLSASLLIGSVGIILARGAMQARIPTGWKAIDCPRAFPMGVSMAFAGFGTLCWSVLETFSVGATPV